MAAPTEQEKLLKDLMKKKDEIEDQIKLWHEVLNSQKGVGMDGPLVDAEQFPRNDIDIPSVRQARHQIVCLQNDHKSLMKEIETELYKFHEQVRLQCEEQPMDVDENQGIKPQPSLAPFARVDRVDTGSPSEKAGLQAADEIVHFGSISVSNFEKLTQIGDLVQHSINKPVSITVLRNGEQLRFSLKPSTWSGRGLLGLTRNSAATVNKEDEGFRYLKTIFPIITDTKIKEGIFIGPLIRHINNDKRFEDLQLGPEKIVQKAFKDIFENFLVNYRAPNYGQLVDSMLQAYRTMNGNLVAGDLFSAFTISLLSC